MENTRTCPHCGTEFTGRSDKVYCSVRCKSAANLTAEPLAQTPDTSYIHYQPTKPSKRSSTSSDGKQQVELVKLELAHKERLRHLELEEAERDRNHEVHQLRRQLVEERRIMAEQMLALQRQYRQLTGQSVDDLPQANRIKDLDEILALASLPPKAEPLPRLPTGIQQEGKAVFDEITERDESEEWTRSELTNLRDDVDYILGQLEKWQSANSRVSLNNLTVYGLLKSVKAVLESGIIKLRCKITMWGEPSMALTLDRTLERALRRFIPE